MQKCFRDHPARLKKQNLVDSFYDAANKTENKL